VRAVRGHLDALEQVIGLHRGRVIRTLGDGLLVEFASVVDAVSCATAMQARMTERNRDLAEAEPYRIRVGVHAGDIIFADDDILGDGVNVAARIEAKAPPGGVAVSSRVYEDVVDKLDLSFADMGEHELKNIDRPVRLFEVRADAPAPAAPPVRRSLPDKPSLAVLPLTNLSPDAADEYFADGLTEDLITALAYVPWIANGKRSSRPGCRNDRFVVRFAPGRQDLDSPPMSTPTHTVNADVVLRPAEAADLEALVALLADDELGIRRERVEDPVAACYRDAFAAIEADPNTEFVVAEADGRIVGCVHLTVIATLSRQGATRALIENVRVASDRRNAGIGQQLVEWAVERAREQGCRLVQLTSDKRRDRAIAFYERLGFVASHAGLKLEL